MGRLVQGLGVLVAIATAASYVGGAHDRAYNLTFVMNQGALRLEKTDPEPYLVGQNHKTTLSLINRSGVEVHFQQADARCNFGFPNQSGPCLSRVDKVANNGTGKIDIKIHGRWNQADCIQSPCATEIQAGVGNPPVMQRVDPQLQIERDTLTPWIRLVLAVTSATMLFGPVAWRRWQTGGVPPVNAGPGTPATS